MVIGLSPTALADGKPGCTLFREPLINCLDGRIAVLGVTHKLAYLFYLYEKYPARDLALRVAASGAQPFRLSWVLTRGVLPLGLRPAKLPKFASRKFVVPGRLALHPAITLIRGS